MISERIWSLWKYRKSSGAIAAKFDDHYWLEIAWTIAATVILVGMAIPSTSVMIKAYDDTEGDINIMVTGYQWKWQYKYLEDGVSFFSNLATSQEEIEIVDPKMDQEKERFCSRLASTSAFIILMYCFSRWRRAS